MRQDHQRHGQNHRGQQRPRNKNRNQNLAQRTLDSNGPDIKLRGTAAHICKKYQTLARDAQSAGDRIRAENYLQHADHYYRLVMAAQQQTAQQQTQQAHQMSAPPPNEAPPNEVYDVREAAHEPHSSSRQGPDNNRGSHKNGAANFEETARGEIKNDENENDAESS